MRLAFRSWVVTLMSIYMLTLPFDCFGTTGFTRETADCCAKGKCLPTKNSDSCCKRTVPNGRDIVTVSSTVAVHDLVQLHAIAVAQFFPPSLIQLSPRFELAYSPPGAAAASRLNLPLLI